mgnify:CR=1 FL=1
MYIVFFGTFNPVTNAHIRIASYVSNFFNNSKIIFVPVSDYYSKNTLNTSFIKRVDMLKLAIKNNKNFIVENIEQEYFLKEHRQLKSYETLNLLKLKYKDQLAFLIGTDNYFDLPNWYNVNNLLKEFKVIVYPRIKNFIKEDMPLYQKYKDDFIFIDSKEIFDISSSKVRESINKDLDYDLLLDKDVKEYIFKNNLKF